MEYGGVMTPIGGQDLQGDVFASTERGVLLQFFDLSGFLNTGHSFSCDQGPAHAARLSRR